MFSVDEIKRLFSGCSQVPADIDFAEFVASINYEILPDVILHEIHCYSNIDQLLMFLLVENKGNKTLPVGTHLIGKTKIPNGTRPYKYVCKQISLYLAKHRLQPLPFISALCQKHE